VKNKKWIKRIVIFLFIVIVISAWYERPVTEHISISSEGKIGKPLKLALITDLHSGYYGENQADLIYMIDKENVDAILLSGDIFDDRLSMDNAEIFCKQIADAYPCYYVTGNHELWSGKEEEIKEKLRTYGVVVLEGNSETISLNGNGLAQYRLSCLTKRHSAHKSMWFWLQKCQETWQLPPR
jgi:predicted MPP superfamily phosphohydrolase